MIATHPLAPMTADEYRATREAVRAAGLLGETTRFAYVGLEELVVARLLDIDEIRDLLDRIHMPEVRTMPEVGLDLGCHLGHFLH